MLREAAVIERPQVDEIAAIEALVDDVVDEVEALCRHIDEADGYIDVLEQSVDPHCGSFTEEDIASTERQRERAAKVSVATGALVRGNVAAIAAAVSSSTRAWQRFKDRNDVIDAIEHLGSLESVDGVFELDGYVISSDYISRWLRVHDEAIEQLDEPPAGGWTVDERGSFFDKTDELINYLTPSTDPGVSEQRVNNLTGRIYWQLYKLFEREDVQDVCENINNYSGLRGMLANCLQSAETPGERALLLTAALYEVGAIEDPEYLRGLVASLSPTRKRKGLRRLLADYEKDPLALSAYINTKYQPLDRLRQAHEKIVATVQHRTSGLESMKRAYQVHAINSVLDIYSTFCEELDATVQAEDDGKLGLSLLTVEEWLVGVVNKIKSIDRISPQDHDLSGNSLNTGLLNARIFARPLLRAMRIAAAHTNGVERPRSIDSDQATADLQAIRARYRLNSSELRKGDRGLGFSKRLMDGIDDAVGKKVIVGNDDKELSKKQVAFMLRIHQSLSKPGVKSRDVFEQLLADIEREDELLQHVPDNVQEAHEATVRELATWLRDSQRGLLQGMDIPAEFKNIARELQVYITEVEAN